MGINKVRSFLIKKKKAIITLIIIIVIAWTLGQFIVPALIKAIFL